jgi:phosphatidylglycerophosphate synthase
LPALALREPQRAYLPIALLTLLFHVLDCVDGNLARTRGTVSARGALLDALVDQAFWCCLFLALGLIVERGDHPFAPHALPLALGCAVMVLGGRRIRDEAQQLSGRRVESYAQRPARLSLWDWLVVLFSGLENLYGVAILIGGYYGALAWVLFAITGYVTVIYLASLGLSFARVRA